MTTQTVMNFHRIIQDIPAKPANPHDSTKIQIKPIINNNNPRNLDQNNIPNRVIEPIKPIIYSNLYQNFPGPQNHY